MQDNSIPTGSMIEPEAKQPFAPAAPGATPLNTGAQLTSDGGTMGATAPAQKKPRNTLIETALLVIVSIIAIVFVWLYIQKYIQWDMIANNVDGQIKTAVAVAEAELTTKMEAEFTEREKSPYEEFAGPEDYGSLNFKYPKTWSVYIAKDAASGGDFEAYLNPKEVMPISNSSINALRVRIRDASFDSVVRSYESSIKNGKLTLSNKTVGGVLANVYEGELSNSQRGVVMVMKVRDKTVIMQTDAEIFKDDFYRVLETVTVKE